jgi:acetyl-CoA carboxylase carboxyltransferase component
MSSEGIAQIAVVMGSCTVTPYIHLLCLSYLHCSHAVSSLFFFRAIQARISSEGISQIAVVMGSCTATPFSHELGFLMFLLFSHFI